MIEYLDEDGKKLEKEFYSYPDSDNLVYFTGKYDEKTGLPIFEIETEMGNERGLPFFVVKRLYKIPKEDVREKLLELKQKTNWLEEKLKE
jgi:uncharacterized alpha/beta hydrolase family protein